MAPKKATKPSAKKDLPKAKCADGMVAGRINLSRHLRAMTADAIDPPPNKFTEQYFLPGTYCFENLMKFEGGVTASALPSPELQIVTVQNTNGMSLNCILIRPTQPLEIGLAVTCYGYIGANEHGRASLLCLLVVDEFAADNQEPNILCSPREEKDPNLLARVPMKSNVDAHLPAHSNIGACRKDAARMLWKFRWARMESLRLQSMKTSTAVAPRQSPEEGRCEAV